MACLGRWAFVSCRARWFCCALVVIGVCGVARPAAGMDPRIKHLIEQEKKKDQAGPKVRTSASRDGKGNASFELRQKIQRLGRIASGTDPQAALEAIEQLHDLGPPARAQTVMVVRMWLVRDRRAIQRASNRSDAAVLKALESQREAIRKRAWANIGKLGKGEPVERARAYYDQLLDLTGKANRYYARRAPAVEALSRRRKLVAIWDQIAPPKDTTLDPSLEKKMIERLEEAMGMSADELAACASFADKKASSDPKRRGLWFYIAARRVGRWNERIKPLMDKEEWRNAHMVNTYRELLGAMPYEFDPRLIQSARRHSKEMADLDFFSHTSPTPENKSAFQRMRNAGYERGYSENIAWGNRSGEKTFWMWFGSPGHHKNMVRKGPSAFGVGRWGSRWTQNMGGGKRLMLASPEQRAEAKVKGSVLPPGT